MESAHMTIYCNSGYLLQLVDLTLHVNISTGWYRLRLINKVCSSKECNIPHYYSWTLALLLVQLRSNDIILLI